ncbi:hypothetical protein ACIPUB_06230 [Paeniglutamicibacter sp. ORCA_105]|uniref:hypothetical protein n=1 Tax=Paeniglutamicibacter sp. ORCA_105 TaxID=3377336 RepID=UPI003893CE4D
MAIAALLCWLVTAVMGLTMFGLWLRNGGLRAARGDASFPTRLVPPLIFGHLFLAVAGLVVWIIYIVNKEVLLAWTALGLLVLVAVLGEMMFLRWKNGRTEGTPESRFPLAIIYGHGLFALATVVLVLLTALGIGT